LQHAQNGNIKIEDINELKIEEIIDCIQQYQENRKSHMGRIDMRRFMKSVLKYIPRGRR
jgi:hypothetical protein